MSDIPDKVEVALIEDRTTKGHLKCFGMCNKHI
jgi:hypothetical protein